MLYPFKSIYRFIDDFVIIVGAKDDLKSPSSRLVTGQLVRGGTGAFQLMQKLKI